MYDPIEEKKKLTGISGWLVLVAITLIIMIIRSVVVLYSTFDALGYPIEQIADYLSISSHDFFILLLFEAISNVLVLLFTLYLTYLFFKKDHRVPKYFIAWCIVKLILIVIDAVFTRNIGLTEDMTGSLREAFRQGVYCVVWIPYFLRSVRVKNTFVRNAQSGLIA